jgi:membrane associated rhomboid family serine protease
VLTKEELKGLLNVLQFYIIAGLMMGIVAATVAVNGGLVLTQKTVGVFATPKAMTAIIVMAIGMATALMAYAVLLPAELKLVRRKLKPEILRRRLSGRK